MSNRMNRILPLGLLMILMATVGLIAAGPLAAEDEGDQPEPYIDLPQSGNWQGAAFFGPAESQFAAQVNMTVSAEGALEGAITFDFRYEGMSEDLIALMDTYGCRVTFDALSPETQPVSGYFADAGRVIGQFSTTECFLEEYGPLTFANPISGVWYADVLSEAAVVELFAPAEAVEPTQAAPEPTEAPAEPTEAAPAGEEGAAAELIDQELLTEGIRVYDWECSECHGRFGEGLPGTAPLEGRRIERMTDEAMLEIINYGVDGTEMSGYNRLLTEEEKAAVMLLIRNLDALRDR